MTEQTQLEKWFHIFWSTFPSDLCHKKKGSKSNALKIIKRINPDEDLQASIMIKLRELIRHCRAEVKTVGKTDRWPMVTTWLNGEMWNNIEDLESSVDMRARAESRKCNCGQPVEIGKLCRSCYTRLTPDSSGWDKLLLAELNNLGLAQAEGESRPDWNRRCREYHVANNVSGVKYG